MKMLINANHFDMNVTDKSLNNIFHQVAIFALAEGLDEDKFCERLEFVLSHMEPELRATNIDRMTVRDLLVKQKLFKAVALVDAEMER